MKTTDSGGNVIIMNSPPFSRPGSSPLPRKKWLWNVSGAPGPTPGTGVINAGAFEHGQNYIYGPLDYDAAIAVANTAQPFPTQAGQKYWGGYGFNYNIRNNYGFYKVT